ncbi:hypothetical protein H696_05633 [Fonticula alba]|uniref:Uncharacterized protein n=1 Tax=Fonticula alba TaxID=691883 RepID=A0A058Z0X0_FONAL|nr:hypothetical protein H696_05633 [Fonticula alba]KCV67904.1 hypothetical protein H696_05633 [Fonticula alba]|eukprot:XP_009497724.1 hypothetical protein H696_05633 [Fonticula alba]
MSGYPRSQGGGGGGGGPPGGPAHPRSSFHLRPGPGMSHGPRFPSQDSAPKLQGTHFSKDIQLGYEPPPPVARPAAAGGRSENFQRRTLDYNNSMIRYLEDRMVWKKPGQRPAAHPDYRFEIHTMPPIAKPQHSADLLLSRYIYDAKNHDKYHVTSLSFLPDGRRMVTGNSHGQLTLWSSLTFNFENIVQAPAFSSPIKRLRWHPVEDTMIVGMKGFIKYYETNLNCVREIAPAHNDMLVCDVSFAPRGSKFVTSGEDKHIVVWDYALGQPELTLSGHVDNVLGVDWHPHRALIASGSQDNQIKLWDPRDGRSAISSLHIHKDGVTSIGWNPINGNWLASTSRDSTAIIYDIRAMDVLQTFSLADRVSSLAWHPLREDILATGCMNGTLAFSLIGLEEPHVQIVRAHDRDISTLSWHPLGHMLASGSNDFLCKFWSLSIPGDTRPMSARPVYRSGANAEEAAALAAIRSQTAQANAAAAAMYAGGGGGPGGHAGPGAGGPGGHQGQRYGPGGGGGGSHRPYGGPGGNAGPGGGGYQPAFRFQAHGAGAGPGGAGAGPGFGPPAPSHQPAGHHRSGM